MIPVRQSTSFETAIGPILDADGVAVTGGVVGDFKIKKTTGAFAALNGSATLTHVSAGIYDLVLTTSDTDTVGLCCIAIDDTTNACASLYLQVMEEAVYDALYAASAVGPLLANSDGSGLTEAGGTGDHLTAINLPDQTMNITGNITGNLSGSVGSVTGAVGSVTGNVGGNVVGSVASVTGAVGSVTGNVGGNVTGSVGSVVAGVNATQISGSSTAADNVEQVFATDFADVYNAVDNHWHVDIQQVKGSATAAQNMATVFDTDFATNYDATNDVWVARITASGLQTDAVQEIRDAITGGSYALSTDANGRVRIVDGTGAGELDTTSGTVLLSAATEAQIDAIETDTNELQADWTNGGRLDLIIDAILVDTGTTLQGSLDDLANEIGAGGDGLTVITNAITVIDNIVDQILADTGTDGVVVNAAGLATDAVQEIRNAITGGAYALSTDASGMVRIVDGTGTGELNTNAGSVALMATGLDAIVPAQPSAEPTFGSATLVQWNAWFAAWSVNPVKSTSSSVVLRDHADATTLATHTTSDNGTTFTSGAAA